MLPTICYMKLSEVQSLERVRTGATIRALREKRGMDQEQLVAACLISRPYIANIEAGRKPVNSKLAAKIAAALGVPQIAISISMAADEVAA